MINRIIKLIKHLWHCFKLKFTKKSHINIDFNPFRTLNEYNMEQLNTVISMLRPTTNKWNTLIDCSLYDDVKISPEERKLNEEATKFNTNLLNHLNLQINPYIGCVSIKDNFSNFENELTDDDKQKIQQLKDRENKFLLNIEK